MNSEKKKKGKIHMLTHRCTRNPTYTHNYALAHTYTRAGTHKRQLPKKVRRYENHTYTHAHTRAHTRTQAPHKHIECIACEPVSLQALVFPRRESYSACHVAHTHTHT